MKKLWLLLYLFLQSAALSLLQAQSSWFYQNPLPQGNILKDVKFISSTVGWAAGDLGTIIKTTDGGNTWISQSSGTSKDIEALYFTDQNNGWAIGNYWDYSTTNYLILHTTNGGATWTEQLSGDGYFLTSLFFTDVNHGIVVGSNGVMFRTTNGGSDWIQQSTGPFDLSYILFTDLNNGITVGGSWVGGVMYKTTDAGVTWNLLDVGTIPALTSISFTDPDNGIAVGGVDYSTYPPEGTILKTTDGGSTWNKKPCSTSVYLYCVFFSSSLNGIAVGGTGTILRTTDGGSTWISQSSGTTDELRSVTFTDENIGLAVGGFGTILSTSDGGTTWIPKSSRIVGDLFDVSFTDANHGTAVGGIFTYNNYSYTQEPLILRTSNGGKNWIQQSAGPTDFFLNAVSFTDQNNGTVVGSKGKILKTTDGGTTWTEQSTGIDPIPDLIDVFFVDQNNGVVVGGSWFSTFILKTTNGGTSWTPQVTGLYSLSRVSFSDINYGTAVGDFGTIFRTTDGGTTWNPQTSGTTATLTGVCFTDQNNGIIVGWPDWSTYPMEGTVLRTTDGGASWVKQSTGDPNFYRGVSFADANNGLVVGAMGTILRTTNGGSTWIKQPPITAGNLFSVDFTDLNAGTAVGTYGVILRTETRSASESLASLIAMVGGLPLNDGEKYALTLKLERARSHYINGNYNAASNLLHAFKNQVNAFVNGNQITSQQALSLIDYANSILEMLNQPLPKTGGDNYVTEYRLDQNYPNPFNPATTINVSVPTSELVTLKVFDVLGKEVAILINDEKPAGSYQIYFDASHLPSGVYFYQLKAGDYIETKKMILIK